MRIALVSDVHLGTPPQYGLRERYEDFLRAFKNFGNSVIKQDVDAVVIGGDLFDSPRPDAHSVHVAMEVVSSIKAHVGSNVLGIDGNHDLSGGEWLRVLGVGVLPDGIAVDVNGVRVVGLSYRNGRDLVSSIKEMSDSGIKADILVAHFALAEMNGGGSADTGAREICPLLEKMGIKCVLMGHVHIPDVRTWNGILFVNPGSTEMKSSNEPKEKFYFVVDTDTWTADEVMIDTRKVDTIEITDENDIESFRTRMESEWKGSVKSGEPRKFYHIIADDTIDDAFKRISRIVHDTSSIARIVMRSSRSRDLAPVVDRAESVATLEGAIEARFPKESKEARLVSSLLHSPDPASVHMIVEKFIGEKA